METYDLHIWYMDDREETVMKISEHYVKDGVLICNWHGWTNDKGNIHKNIGCYPIHNIRKYVVE
jgi:hypothetical protein